MIDPSFWALDLESPITVWYPTQTLRWDAERMRFTNFAAANRHVKPVFRKGWSL
ncbi:MAG: hypothetical protein U9R68_08370 [Planctomycetota bacterium]|nr:hypothetical protein [Planctomycetota bacterium]